MPPISQGFQGQTRAPAGLAKRLAAWLLLILVLLALAVLLRGHYAYRDRLAGYSLDLSIDGTKAIADARALRAGFGRIKITPDLSGRRIWLAGFSQNRAATGIHDDLWAIGCIIDDGHSRLGIVALDAIGFFHDDVVRVRQRISAELKLDYIIICSTHNHSTPDLLGLWGPNYLKTGVDADYRQQVIAACGEALRQATARLEPARVGFHEITVDPEGLVADTRKPEVFDPDLRVMHFLKAASQETLGTLVTWGNHPETVWAGNTEITSDFCGYLRDALAGGITAHGSNVVAGVGGEHLFINGAIGGLMSTTPSVVVRDPLSGEALKEPSHAKARAVGQQIAMKVLPSLQGASEGYQAQLPISVRARTVSVKLANKGYLLAGFLGLIDRGHAGWGTLRTEVGLVTLGDASIACIPGEIYPELVNGGIEKPFGGDYEMEIAEQPPIRELMPGRIKFVFGLANDEIGYIIPKTQWDERKPYTYGKERAPYGEINSVGPDASPILHKVIQQFCREMKNPDANTASGGGNESESKG